MFTSIHLYFNFSSEYSCTEVQYTVLEGFLGFLLSSISVNNTLLYHIFSLEEFQSCENVMKILKFRIYRLSFVHLFSEDALPHFPPLFAVLSHLSPGTPPQPRGMISITYCSKVHKWEGPDAFYLLLLFH